MPRHAWAAVLLLVPLAGCADAKVDAGDFTLAATRIGWNVTETASFNLTLDAAGGLTYTVDPVFALQSLALKTGGVRGDFATDRLEDLGLELRVGNATVREHRLREGADTVEIRFRLPQELRDDAYVLELEIFQVGTVKSGPFRVNRP